ncbi:PRTRC system protein B [Elizabethkingia anophelis]|nr:PRTRC system protein B [Elizabethkingia anophelis]
MKDITPSFTKVFYPQSALIVYQAKEGETYVEHFDMDRNGIPVNAHPLTVREASRLAKVLTTASKEKEPVLKPDSVVSEQILYFDTSIDKVIWYTKGMSRQILFTEDLGIPNGTANVPPMLWVADRNNLAVFALANNRRPTKKTKLFNAPFFNVYDDGNVCMGSVDTEIKKTASLEEFTAKWEGFFFNSYFSHLMRGYNPIKGNCVSLWESLISNDKAFPTSVLTDSGLTLKELL